MLRSKERRLPSRRMPENLALALRQLIRDANQNLLVDVATSKPLAMKIRSQRKVIRFSPGEGRGMR